MNFVDVVCREIACPPNVDEFPEFCSGILDALEVDGWELSVLFCDDDMIRELNRTYRGIDQSTDVLSFSQFEGPPGPRSADRGEAVTAGDIVVSLETTQRQSEERGVPFDSEIKRLLVHGILHLSGMDHWDEQSRMIELQEQLLREMEERWP
jgi:probable rRNA maturation factor